MDRGAIWALFALIEEDALFQNNSIVPQAAVRMQLMVALYRLGHITTLHETGTMFGMGLGTVIKYTRRIVDALCAKLTDVIWWPSADEKAQLKERSR